MISARKIIITYVLFLSSSLYSMIIPEEIFLPLIIEQIILSHKGLYSFQQAIIKQQTDENGTLSYKWEWPHKDIPETKQYLKRILNNLYYINKTWYHYFSQEKSQIHIIDICNKYTFYSEHDIAHRLGYKRIRQKIQYFHHKASLVKEFSQKELSEDWYLKSQICLNDSIINSAIRRLNLEKIKTLLPYAKNIHPNLYILQATTFLMHTGKSKKRRINQDKLYNVIKFFLEQSVDLNYRPHHYWNLPLFYTVNSGNIRLTRLLLFYGANPNERIIDFNGPLCIFSYEKGEPKGWLMNMYNAIQTHKIIHGQK